MKLEQFNSHLKKIRKQHRGAKLSVNFSSVQKFLESHIYKLCHIAFICIKYKM